jgi:transcription antitermination factor NusG
MKDRNNIYYAQDAINQLSKEEHRWFAVYTRYKCEKYVADHLEKKQIEAYVPVMTKTRRYANKIRHSAIPLINCYVFVHINEYKYLPTLETEYVIKFLRQGKDLLAIPQYEIELLKRVAGDVEQVETIDEKQIKSGEIVEVISGHLAGMKGRIISKSGKHNFYVDLETIGFQLRIKIDLKLLKPVKYKNLIA